MITQTFGERLKMCMTTRGNTWPELAKACGVTRQAVYRWRDDEVRPTSAVAQKAAEFLNVSYSWLISGDGRMRQPVDLDDDQRQMIELFTQLVPDDREAVIRHASSLLASYPTSKFRLVRTRNRS